MTRRLLLPALLAALAPAAAAQPSPLDAATQAVVVRTGGWSERAAELRRWERPDTRSPWRPAGEPVAAVVGRTGLAADPLQAAAFAAGAPVKREGDGRAPAGVFPLTAAFGYAPAPAMAHLRLPYHAADADLECVDDAASPHYNRIVRRDTVADPSWASHEEMVLPDGRYELGVVVGYNDPPVAGRGSCIFLHVWAGPSVPTSGCTAMAREEMAALQAWLDPAARPVLVQLPAAEWERRPALAARFAAPAAPRRADVLR